MINFRNFQVTQPEEGRLKVHLRAEDGDVCPAQAAVLFALGAGNADNGPGEPVDPHWPNGLFDAENRRVWHQPTQEWLNDYATFPL